MPPSHGRSHTTPRSSSYHFEFAALLPHAPLYPARGRVGRHGAHTSVCVTDTRNIQRCMCAKPARRRLCVANRRYGALVMREVVSVFRTPSAGHGSAGTYQSWHPQCARCYVNHPSQWSGGWGNAMGRVVSAELWFSQTMAVVPVTFVAVYRVRTIVSEPARYR